MCPSLANKPTTNDQDWYNQIGRAAVKSHGDGIIGAYADGHAKKEPYKKYMKNNATFATSPACERELTAGPDGNWGSPDDPDNDVRAILGPPLGRELLMKRTFACWSSPCAAFSPGAAPAPSTPIAPDVEGARLPQDVRQGDARVQEGARTEDGAVTSLRPGHPARGAFPGHH